MPVLGIGTGRALFHSPPVAASSLGLQTNLSAFFELSSDGSDSTGNVTNLTNNGSATFVSDTIGGVSVNVANLVAASSQYFSHANDSHLIVGGGDFSINIWHKATTLPSNALINCETTSFPQNGFKLGNRFTTGNIWYGTILIGGSGSSYRADGAAASTGVWTMITMVYNKATGVNAISVNGGSFANAGSNTGGTSPSSETAVFQIGKDANAAAYADGRICRVGIWQGRALGSSDVTALYNGGAGLSYAAMA
jgi:hypothetical protein